MFKKTVCITLIACSLTGIVGCTNMGPKETGGRLLGGAAGALIGSQFGRGTGRLVGVAIGTLAGSYIGGAMGNRMDAQDRAMAQRAMLNSLESAPDNCGKTWRNPNNGHSGNVKVTRTQEMPNSHLVCRDYVHTVIIDGKEETVHGRACRDMRDTRGEWMVQK